MLLVCTNCNAQYEVADAAIPESGREVQCTNCNFVWHQMPAAAALAATAAPDAISPDEIAVGTAREVDPTVANPGAFVEEPSIAAPPPAAETTPAIPSEPEPMAETGEATGVPAGFTFQSRRGPISDNVTTETQSDSAQVAPEVAIPTPPALEPVPAPQEAQMSDIAPPSQRLDPAELDVIRQEVVFNTARSAEPSSDPIEQPVPNMPIPEHGAPTEPEPTFAAEVSPVSTETEVPSNEEFTADAVPAAPPAQDAVVIATPEPQVPASQPSESYTPSVTPRNLRDLLREEPQPVAEAAAVEAYNRSATEGTQSDAMTPEALSARQAATEAALNRIVPPAPAPAEVDENERYDTPIFSPAPTPGAEQQPESTTAATPESSEPASTQEIEPHVPPAAEPAPQNTDVATGISEALAAAGAPAAGAMAMAASEAEPVDDAKSVKRKKGRDRFANVDDLGETLAENAERQAGMVRQEFTDPEIEEEAPEPRIEDRRFWNGFWLAFAVMILAVLVYLFAERIVLAVPQLAGIMEPYVEFVDGLRAYFGELYARGGDPGLGNFFSNLVNDVLGN